jgi:hypothetical protein
MGQLILSSEVCAHDLDPKLTAKMTSVVRTMQRRVFGDSMVFSTERVQSTLKDSTIKRFEFWRLGVLALSRFAQSNFLDANIHLISNSATTGMWSDAGLRTVQAFFALTPSLVL